MHKNKGLVLSKIEGFTLIELLVVIAIIGILSGIVLTSLGTARNKAKDAAIKSQLSSLRTQAEIYYDGSASYGTAGAACNTASSMWADTGVVDIVTKIGTDGGTMSCNNSTTAWAAYSDLISSTDYFCVDSNGSAKQTTSAPTITDQACD
ncbi:MAG: type II secretion system protein [bacterium]|nr:type II secretion system protein [bacterium]